MKINGNLSDSGLLITGSVIYQKRYGFVYVSFSGVHVNSIRTWETIATLPEGFRPSNTVCGTAYSTDLSAALYMIEVSGNVNIFASNVAIGLAANTMFIAK